MANAMVFLAALAVAYVAIEITVRVFRLPDRELVKYIERALKHPDAFTWPGDPVPRYGWGRDEDVVFAADDAPVRATATAPSAGDAVARVAATAPGDAPAAPASTLLFVGDSVTRGKDVADATKVYPAVLRELLRPRRVRVVDAAVNAFGVDQMTMKLEDIVPRYEPDVAVLAYIPVDLWRPARDMNYGLTKPVLRDIGPDDWRIVPPVPMAEYYARYLHARRFFHRGPWAVQHVWTNARYYFPALYRDWYAALYRTMRTRLVVLAERTGIRVLVARLPSTWPAPAAAPLDTLARETFADTAPGYGFVDVEPCVRARATAAGLDYDREFRWHPTERGHALVAACLVDRIGVALDPGGS